MFLSWNRCLGLPDLHIEISYTYIYIDVHVKVHRNKLLIINQLNAQISQIYIGMKIYMFRAVPLSVVMSFPLYTQQWCMSYKFAYSLQAVSRLV
jgi:hypothetical protein